MPLQDFKVPTFDVVGTLIDFERGMLDYLRQAAPDAKVPDDEFLAAYRRARAIADASWFPNDVVRVWHAVAAELGLPDSAALADGLRDSVARWPAFPDSVAALKRLPQPRGARRRGRGERMRHPVSPWRRPERRGALKPAARWRDSSTGRITSALAPSAHRPMYPSDEGQS